MSTLLLTQDTADISAPLQRLNRYTANWLISSAVKLVSCLPILSLGSELSFVG